MIRGTTPKHIFTLPDCMLDASFDALYITYQQRGMTVLEKTLDDVERIGTDIVVHLTQAETLEFAQGQKTEPVRIQIRARTDDGEAFASDIMEISVDQVLKDGEI